MKLEPEDVKIAQVIMAIHRQGFLPSEKGARKVVASEMGRMLPEPYRYKIIVIKRNI